MHKKILSTPGSEKVILIQRFFRNYLKNQQIKNKENPHLQEAPLNRRYFLATDKILLGNQVDHMLKEFHNIISSLISKNFETEFKKMREIAKKYANTEKTQQAIELKEAFSSLKKTYASLKTTYAAFKSLNTKNILEFCDNTSSFIEKFTDGVNIISPEGLSKEITNVLQRVFTDCYVLANTYQFTEEIKDICQENGITADDRLANPWPRDTSILAGKNILFSPVAPIEIIQKAIKKYRSKGLPSTTIELQGSTISDEKRPALIRDLAKDNNLSIRQLDNIDGVKVCLEGGDIPLRQKN